MKKLLSVLFLTCAFSVVSFAGKSDYLLNTTKVNQMFDNAIEISIDNLVKKNLIENSVHKFSMMGDDVQTTILIALVVEAVGLGSLGIHRYVLGTKPSMFALYCFTCGGIFGIVPLVDFVVLVIDGLLEDEGEKYIDNEKFLMWIE